MRVKNFPIITIPTPRSQKVKVIFPADFETYMTDYYAKLVIRLSTADYHLRLGNGNGFDELADDDTIALADLT